jgi:SAM-dependent methyltransferase
LPLHPVLRQLRRIAARAYGIDKRRAEARFWKIETKKYVKWYHGHRSQWPTPSPVQRITSCDTDEKNATMTFNLLYQQPRYLQSLQLDSGAFERERVLDVGSGPHPGAVCFRDCELFNLDPLMPFYRQLGYPTEEYGSRCHFIGSAVEKIPFRDRSIDAVISVNSIDHVDDLELASKEIQRVLRKGGKFRMHVNYHSPTIAEPHALTDEIFLSVFSWVQNLRKISETKGISRPEIHESHVLWSNF